VIVVTPRGTFISPAKISFLLSGREGNQDFELFLDVVEPMLQSSLDENDGPGPYLGVVGANLHAGMSADDVVHLVFAVRFLGIGAAFRKDVDASAHGGDAEEFEIESALFAPLAGEIVDVEEVTHKVARS